MNSLLSYYRQLPRWKKIALLVFFIFLIGVSIFWIMLQRQTTGYIFENVKKTTITEVVSDSGKIISDGKIEVYSPTNGIIQEMYVQNGQAVKEDDQLFRVKSSATAQEQQNAYAAYLAAVAAQNTAETLLHTYRSGMYVQWKTFTDLATNSTYESSKGIPNLDNRKSAEFQSTQDMWLAAEKQFKDQEQAVSAAQAQVNASWNAYLATQTSNVTAQIDGIIQNVSVSVGKSVNAPSILTTNATPVLTIAQSATVEAVLQIGQTDIAKIKTGQHVVIHPDPYKDITYEARVERVDALGQDTQGVVTYNVYVTFTSTDNILFAGMTVDGDITTNIKENVLTVPNSAIVLHNGVKTVRILKNNSLTYIPVSVGIKGESRSQILSGIVDGQQIVVALTNEKAAKPSFMGL